MIGMGRISGFCGAGYPMYTVEAGYPTKLSIIRQFLHLKDIFYFKILAKFFLDKERIKSSTGQYTYNAFQLFRFYTIFIYIYSGADLRKWRLEGSFQKKSGGLAHPPRMLDNPAAIPLPKCQAFVPRHLFYLRPTPFTYGASTPSPKIFDLVCP